MHRDVYVWIQYYIQHTHAHTRMHTHTHAHNHTHTIHTHATHTHTITHSYDTHTGTHTHTQSHTHLLFERLLCLLLVSVQDVLQTLLVWSHGPQPFLCQLTCHLIPHLSWLGEGQKRGEEGQRESRGRRRDGSRDWLQPFNKSNLTLYLLLDVHVLNMHSHTHTHIYIYIKSGAQGYGLLIKCCQPFAGKWELLSALEGCCGVLIPMDYCTLKSK